MTTLLEPVYALMLTFNFFKNHQKYQYELIPNCLLTLYPIIFVGSQNREIQNCLEAHGYDVFEIKKSEIQDFLKLTKGQCFHFATDEHHIKLLDRAILEQNYKPQSITLISPLNLRSKNPKAQYLKWVKMTEAASSHYLQWAISLAEKDLT